MSSDGGAGGRGGADAPVGRPGGYFDYSDVEFEAAQAAQAAQIDFASGEILAGRKKTVQGRSPGVGVSEIPNLNQAVVAVQDKYGLDKQAARAVVKEANLAVAAPPVATVMGHEVRQRDIITGVLDPSPMGVLSKIGETMFWSAWDQGWDVEAAESSQGFLDTGDFPDVLGVEAAGPGPDFDVAAPLPVVEDTIASTGRPGSAGAVPAAKSEEAVSGAAATGATATPLTAVGAATSRAKRRGSTATIATSTLGLPSPAPVARPRLTAGTKTLLGA